MNSAPARRPGLRPLDRNHATDEVKSAALSAARVIDTIGFGIRTAAAAQNAALAAIAGIAKTNIESFHLDRVGQYAAKSANPSMVDALDTGAKAIGLVADLEWFDRGKAGPALAATRLWPKGGVPKAWSSRAKRLCRALLSIDPSWRVWTKWYFDRVRGAAYNVEIERKCVLIPAEIWSEPPPTVNAYIAKIRGSRDAARAS